MRTHHEGTQERQRNPTRAVAEAARLFNLLGYTVTSLDIVERELRVRWEQMDPSPGGEQLAREAFDFSAAASDRLLRTAVEAEETGPGKLDAFVTAFRSAMERPPVEGGSPALFAALPSFEALPFLEARVRAVVDGWRHHVRRIIRLGIRRGEFRPSALPEQVASIVVGTMEGAMFLHRLYGDASHVDRSIAYLHRYFESEVLA